LQQIEETIHDAWCQAATSETREELWFTLKGAERFKTILEVMVSTGEFTLAHKEIDNART